MHLPSPFFPVTPQRARASRTAHTHMARLNGKARVRARAGSQAGGGAASEN